MNRAFIFAGLLLLSACSGDQAGHRPPNPSSPISFDDLRVANLDNVGRLVTPFAASSGNLRVVGGYADEARTVFIVAGVHVTSSFAPMLRDDQGAVTAKTISRPLPSGATMFEFDSELRSNSGSESAVLLTIGPTFSLKLRVQPSSALEPPAPVVAGPGHYAFQHAYATPNAIGLDGSEDGTPFDALFTRASVSAPQILDPTGATTPWIDFELPPVNADEFLSFRHEVKVRATWKRRGPGTYRVLFSIAGQRFQRTVLVP